MNSEDKMMNLGREFIENIPATLFNDPILSHQCPKLGTRPKFGHFEKKDL